MGNYRVELVHIVDYRASHDTVRDCCRQSGHRRVEKRYACRVESVDGMHLSGFHGPRDAKITDVCWPPLSVLSSVVRERYCSSLRTQMIRLVTFDALHTLITPRKPIHLQYSEVFSPYLGTLPPDAIARSFKLGVLFFYTFHIATVRLRQTRGSDSATASREAVVPCRCDEMVERGHFPDSVRRGR